MQETYIKKVRRALVCSAKQKKEILRDLEEIFASAAEHGQSAADVMDRLGTPEEYAKATEEQLGVNRKIVLRRRALLTILPPTIFAPILFLMYKITFPFTYHEQMSVGIIGGADGPTSILIATSPVSPYVAPVLLGLIVFCAITVVIGLVWYLRKRKQ